jgi:hypothetical protein
VSGPATPPAPRDCTEVQNPVCSPVRRGSLDTRAAAIEPPSCPAGMLSPTHHLTPAGFIEPCLPSRERPPGSPDWVHEIKHDGYRLMARRDPIGIGLITRNGRD